MITITCWYVWGATAPMHGVAGEMVDAAPAELSAMPAVAATARTMTAAATAVVREMRFT